MSTRSPSAFASADFTLVPPVLGRIEDRVEAVDLHGTEQRDIR